jgi:hypothetical protein
MEENMEEQIKEEEKEPVRSQRREEAVTSSKFPTMLVLAILLGAIAGALAGLAVSGLFQEEEEDTPIIIRGDNVGIGATSPDSELDVDGVITAEGGDSDEWNTAYGWGDHAQAGYLTDYAETDPVFGVSAAAGITSGDITDWDTAFGWGDHSTQGYLTSESDPVYGVSAAAGITSGSINNWNTAYSWGDHSTQGYLTSSSAETDPVYGASVASGIVSGDINNWNIAFGWGNHSTAGYLTSYTETDPVFGVSVVSGITSGNITNWDTAFGWGNHAAAGYITGESDPQVGTITLDHVPKWDGNALINSTIFDNGNIGIGTTSPTAKTHIVQTAAAYAFRVDDMAGDTTPFVIDEYGRVGVGTTDIYDVVDVYGRVRVRKVGPTFAGFILANSTGALKGGFVMNGNVGPSIYADGQGYVVNVRNDNGNVGIGTASPTSPLHVVGLPVYANNAAALGGGLTAGAFYRTGGDPDQVCVVH